jgi:putative tryptophan/tyrosine transport system substrate-binding protein
MRRREFIGLLGSALAFGRPLRTNAQQSARPLIGFLSSRSQGGAQGGILSDLMAEFHFGLRDTGYVEGKNLEIEYRWADGQNDRLPALAADLIRRQVVLIVTPDSTPAALAAKAATSTIPIVFGIGTDPVAVGLVDRLDRPGGNITGVTTLSSELAAKWLEVLRAAVPRARAFGLLVNPAGNPLAQSTTKDVRAMADALGLELHVVHASTDRELEPAFDSLGRLGVGGLVIGPDSLFTSRPERLAILANQHAIPAIYWVRDFAVAGGLMSYGTRISQNWRQCGVYAGRVLKGEKPAELPVVQVSKVDLTINLKTAKALQLTIPESLLVRADEVIE